MKKLHSKRGETMVETLAAVLIVGLAAAMLATMVASAVRITSRTKEADAVFYRELSAAEEKTKMVGETNVTISVTGGSASEAKDITLYGTQDGLTAYEVKVP